MQTLLVVADSPIHGKGIFTTRDIKRGEIIPLPSIEEMIAMREAGNLFVGMNHSCDPNVAVIDADAGHKLAIKDMVAGEELTISYGPRAYGNPNCGCQVCRHESSSF